MSNSLSHEVLVGRLKKLVERYGAAQVAVFLNYRDTRAINVWLATKTIPKARRELVKSVLRQQGKRQ